MTDYGFDNDNDNDDDNGIDSGVDNDNDNDGGINDDGIDNGIGVPIENGNGNIDVDDNYSDADLSTQQSSLDYVASDENSVLADEAAPEVDQDPPADEGDEVVAKQPKSAGGFFPSFNRGTKEVKQSSAGAGFVGLIGFGAMLLIASVFFITENYFISMFTISIGLLIYVTGWDLIILAFSTFIIFFSSKHLNTRASSMQETIVALKNLLNIRRGRDGSIAVGPVDSNVSIELPDNSLSRDIQELVSAGKSFDYAEFVAHSYYVECHELYESSSSNYDFVSATMPLFGLIGTIIGLIAMFDSLGSDVTVESLSPQLALALKTTLYGAIFSSFYKIIGTRFERRMVDLDYDYDTFCRALQVIMENNNTIEIE
jgi:biopolymer transport protein ExbB/TolQ